MVGINKFGNLPKEIAKYLKMPNPESYTGHCFRRSSATILVDAGGDMISLKRHGGWQSTAVAEGYIDNSLNNKIKTANTIREFVENTKVLPHANTKAQVLEFQDLPSTSATFNVNAENNTPNIPSVINISNCQNVTIQYMNK